MEIWNEEILPENTLLDHRYRILKVLGNGGFGITYEAINERINRRVAIKELFIKEYVERNSTVSNDVTVRNQEEVFCTAKEKFLKEARTISDFSEEPGVVGILDYFEANHTAYIVMEYLNGQTLKNYYKENGKIDANELIKLLFPVMETLEKIHKCGVIHRDISPDNLILMPDQSIKLIDFGSARDYVIRKTHTVELKGGYTPPEQYGEGIQGPWTDVYALCAVIYHGITGKKPENSIMRMLHDELQMPSELGIKTEPEMEQILKKGLQIIPDQRWQSMEEMIKAFQPMIKPEPKNIPKWVKVMSGIAMAIGMSAVIAGGVRNYYQNHPEKFKFRGKRTEHLILAPDEKMTNQDYQEAKEIIKKRLDVLVGNDNYLLDADEEQMNLIMTFPMLQDAAGDIESQEEDLLKRFITQPIKLQPAVVYTEKGVIGNRYSELRREEVLSVEVKEGAIPISYYLPKYVKENNEIPENAYLKITISKEAAERLKNHLKEKLLEDGNFMVLKIDLETAESYNLFLCTDPYGDWTVLYQTLESTDSERWKAIWEIPELSEPMQIYLEEKGNWETDNKNRLWGGMQKTENKIQQPYVILKYEQLWQSTILESAAWKEKVLDIKQKLDTLGISYAFGTAIDDERKVLIKVEQKYMNPALANTLMAGTESVCICDENHERLSGIYKDHMFAEKTETGEWKICCEINEETQSTLSELAAEKIKEGQEYAYLTLNGYKVSRKKWKDITENGKLEFSENLWNEGKIFTEEDRPLLEFIQILQNTKKDIYDEYELSNMEYHGADGKMERNASCQEARYFPEQEEYIQIRQMVKNWDSNAEVEEECQSWWNTLTIMLKMDLSRSYAKKVTDFVETLFHDNEQDLERYETIYIYLDDKDYTQKLTFGKKEEKWWLDYRMLGSDDPLETELRERIKSSEFFSEYIDENSGWEIPDSEDTK